MLKLNSKVVEGILSKIFSVKTKDDNLVNVTKLFINLDKLIVKEASGGSNTDDFIYYDMKYNYDDIKSIVEESFNLGFHNVKGFKSLKLTYKGNNMELKVRFSSKLIDYQEFTITKLKTQITNNSPVVDNILHNLNDDLVSRLISYYVSDKPIQKDEKAKIASELELDYNDDKRYIDVVARMLYIEYVIRGTINVLEEVIKKSFTYIHNTSLDNERRKEKGY